MLRMTVRITFPIQGSIVLEGPNTEDVFGDYIVHGSTLFQRKRGGIMDRYFILKIHGRFGSYATTSFLF